MTTMEPIEAISALMSLRDEIQRLDREAWELEKSIMAQMEADGAKVLDHPNYVVALEPTYIWDDSRLAPLREFFAPGKLEELGAWAPEHLEIVPAKWDRRKVLTLRNRGHDIAAVIEAARVPGAPKLVVKPKSSKEVSREHER